MSTSTLTRFGYHRKIKHSFSPRISNGFAAHVKREDGSMTLNVVKGD